MNNTAPIASISASHQDQRQGDLFTLAEFAGVDELLATATERLVGYNAREILVLTGTWELLVIGGSKEHPYDLVRT